MVTQYAVRNILTHHVSYTQVAADIFQGSLVSYTVLMALYRQLD
jgi:hypothetical protein